MSDLTLPEQLERAAKCVYAAVDQKVADDLSRLMTQAARELRSIPPDREITELRELCGEGARALRCVLESRGFIGMDELIAALDAARSPSRLVSNAENEG